MSSTPAIAPAATVAAIDAAAHAPTTPLEEAQKTAATTRQGQRDLHNTQILEASLQVSIQAGNEGLSLLYRTAIDEINAALEPELGPDAIQNALSQDNSPEATAGRIVSMSTAMFHTFAALHPDKDLADVARAFVETIRSGFEQGYAEAQDILNSLGVLGEGSTVAAEIGKTYELVHKGYENWLHAKLSQLQGTETGNTPASAAPAAEPSAP